LNERPYHPNDLPNVIEVYTAAIHSLAAPFYSPEQLAAWAPPTTDRERWQKSLASVHTIVADDNGVIAGFVSYKDDGYVHLLFTHPAYARRGVATRLYGLIESALRSVGCPKVFTHASLAARPFFERQGFHVDAEESVECRSVFLRRFSMHKQLTVS
jgi:putative acetyltransferase